MNPLHFFRAGTAALSLPTSELIALRHLLPPRTISREELGETLHRLKLPDAGFADALFALADLGNTGSMRSRDFIATYANLRQLALEAPDAEQTALALVFLSAGGGAETVTWNQWLALGGELGLSVGGVDSLPTEEVAEDAKRRWYAKRMTWKKIMGKDGLSLDIFVQLMKEGDVGLLESLRAIGFVLVHAVIRHADAPVEKPAWKGDSESAFLSQYMTFAITSAMEQAPSEVTDSRTKSRSQELGESSGSDELTTDDSNASSSEGNPDDLPPLDNLRENAVMNSKATTTQPVRMSPFPDVQKVDRAESAQRTIDSTGSRPRGSSSASTSSARTSSSGSGWSTSSSARSARGMVRRTRNMKTGSSPFHIDFSSLDLEGKIGSGAYGDVYKGTFLMSPVAVKMFHVNVNNTMPASSPSVGEDDDPSQMSRMVSMNALQRFASVNSQAKYKNFVREVEMMSVVRHPNLVLYMGACGDPVTPLCIVSELFTGGSLHEYLHNDDDFRPPVRTSVNFSLNIARGMFYLHSSQPSILHRDLKSRNVLLSGRKSLHGVPHVVICDFGLCQLFGEEGQSGSSGANAMGTASYMAPDVIGGGKYEAADDVYSFGVLMHEIFTASIPYMGMRAMQVLFRVSNEGLRPNCEWDTEIPPKMKELMEDCWAAERSKRPTFDQIIERLNEFEQTLEE